MVLHSVRDILAEIVAVGELCGVFYSHDACTVPANGGDNVCSGVGGIPRARRRGNMVLAVLPVGREVGMEEPMEGVSKVQGIRGRGDRKIQTACSVGVLASVSVGACHSMCACGRQKVD